MKKVIIIDKAKEENFITINGYKQTETRRFLEAKALVKMLTNDISASTFDLVIKGLKSGGFIK